jgi:hypothetical protein
MGGVLISTIDFAKGTITFANYDAFFERYWMEAPGELITSHYADQDGKSIYLKRSTCVEATKCMCAPDLEAIEVDMSPIASKQKTYRIMKYACFQTR